MTRVDCTHPRANHQHGTYLAYERDKCRCDDCRWAGSRHKKHIRHRTATGTHTYVDAEPLRPHVSRLLEDMNLGQLERRSGVNRTAIKALMGSHGHQASKRVTRKTRDALLRVRPGTFGDEAGGLVDATGTIRRIQALAAIGWPVKTQCQRLGLSTRTTWKITNHPSRVVTVRIRDAVRDLYNELSMTVPPPSQPTTLAKNHARRKGWPPPLAWDDDIDHPDATPAEGWDAPATKDSSLDEWWHLIHGGDNPARAAQTIGVTLVAVEARARRLNDRKALHLITAVLRTERAA